MFGGWKFERDTTKLHNRILMEKDTQKKKSNIFIVGSSINAIFVLPVRHGTDIALQKKI
jgi:hypothetical protein